METVHLDQCFRPAGTYELVRLGGDHDGGYLVDPAAVAASDILLSFGIGEDWRFEQDFVNRHDVPLEAFDATLTLNDLLQRQAQARRKLYRRSRRNQLRRATAHLESYERLFRGNHRHHAYFVGMDRAPNYVSLVTVAERYLPAGSNDVFLKIDIEGWEYRLLDDLLALSDRICGLVIEFHDIDLHGARIADFMARLGMNICHVHANNWAPVAADSTPLVVEVSFTRRAPDAAQSALLPHPLDQPNNAGVPDYRIAFRD